MRKDEPAQYTNKLLKIRGKNKNCGAEKNTPGNDRKEM